MQKFIEKLIQAHKNYSNNVPSVKESHEFLKHLLGFLFPQLRQSALLTGPSEYSAACSEISTRLENLLDSCSAENCSDFLKEFPQKLEPLYDILYADAQSILNGDPAARCIEEVISAYPGFLAIAIHRIAHEFYLSDIPVLPRLFSEYAHKITGIDIHPGAKIGSNFCIDHGTGIVIGETTVIKNNVKIYQGVTLGALSVEKSLADVKRHPTIEENVVIYANATILGGDTVIGKNSVIGGNVWITSSIPENSMVYHSSENKIKKKSN